jgi:hypothetical protein
MMLVVCLTLIEDPTNPHQLWGYLATQKAMNCREHPYMLGCIPMLPIISNYSRGLGLVKTPSDEDQLLLNERLDLEERLVSPGSHEIHRLLHVRFYSSVLILWRCHLCPTAVLAETYTYWI